MESNHLPFVSERSAVEPLRSLLYKSVMADMPWELSLITKSICHGWTLSSRLRLSAQARRFSCRLTCPLKVRSPFGPSAASLHARLLCQNVKVLFFGGNGGVQSSRSLVSVATCVVTCTITLKSNPSDCLSSMATVCPPWALMRSSVPCISGSIPLHSRLA